jgi:Lrp/AsnC family leucine-responsive transcriptional regulator
MTVDAQKLLDDVGWRILEELQRDGRLTFAELGRRVNLSLPAVAERVRRLEEAGIITGYHATVDPTKLGLPITALIRIRELKRGCGGVTALAAARPEIRECYRVTGTDSFVVKAVVSSIDHLDDLLKKLRPYGTFSTSIVLEAPIVKRVVGQEEADGQHMEGLLPGAPAADDRASGVPARARSG